jgi:hypothetical protein
LGGFVRALAGGFVRALAGDGIRGVARAFAIARADSDALERALQRLLVLVDQLGLGFAPFGDEPAFC